MVEMTRTVRRADNLSDMQTGAPGPTNGALVLVVEDEATVRVFCATVLRRSGYRVVEAAGPAEALDAVQQLPEPLGLVLTDVTMPGMNGQEMVKRIDRDRQPDMKVLYMTGYSENMRSGLNLLEKPFTSADLLKRVRETFPPRA